MSVTEPKGFRAAAATAGLKDSGAPDVALVVNDGPRDAAAAVYTSNRCRANPVLWSERASADGRVRAVVLNSGGANCYTGPEGFQVTHATAERVAAGLSAAGVATGAGDVVVCSTGLIGVPLDEAKLSAGVDAALSTLSVAGGPAAAVAIMTTDTQPKESAIHRHDGWSVGGMAKGAGMLAPGLATMLVVLTTDADVDASACDRALRAASRITFDRLDTDGCMSTNDTVVLMASGASGVAPEPDDFDAAVLAVCRDLALQLLADAEGAEHEITVEVRNAVTEDEALEVARAIGRSNLFKCAVFGRDPNWGRVLAAAGTTSAAFDPDRVDVALNGVEVCRDGRPGDSRDEVDLMARGLTVTVDLKAGAASAWIWTTDLTTEYVRENSAYST